jgi:hypothetical protein
MVQAMAVVSAQKLVVVMDLELVVWEAMWGEEWV